LFFYPVIVISLAELPPAPILKRILVVEPFVVGIGILNPLFEKQTFVLGGFTFSAGWITLYVDFCKEYSCTCRCVFACRYNRDEQAGGGFKNA